MITKIAKEYRWEMSHRLPFHDGLCKNIHGHSYKMRVELSGNLNENSMVMDYYGIDRIVKPAIEVFDHSFLCDENDSMMLNFLKENNFRYFTIPNFTTVENILTYFIDKFKPEFGKFVNLQLLKVRVYETEDAFAEREISLV
jgi:6-pyruvoyltetrahydropterin/6-carboxytetrahydropterin synthase